jgi:hypothetical protein
MISHGLGLLIIPEKQVPAFKKLLIAYYEGEDTDKITDFLKTKCWRKMN